MSYLEELREDFERWWLTATFQEKAQMMALGAYTLMLLAMPVIAAVRGPKHDS